MCSTKCWFVAGILSVISLSRCDDSCQGEEWSAVQALASSLGINSYIFVQDDLDAGTLATIRGFSGRGFSVVIDSERLVEILKSRKRQKVFFDRNTIVVTKEVLNFTWALKKLSGLHTVSWAIFVGSVADVNDSYIPLNSNFFTFRCDSGVLNVDKAYHIKPGLPISARRVGEWPEGGTEEPFKTERRANVDFGKATLNFLYLSNDDECRTETHVLYKIECYHQEIVRMISERLNFRTNPIRCPERYHPYNYPNGSLSDMFVLLERGTVDVSSGSYIITDNRLMYFDFAWPVFTTRSLMYIKYESVKNMWLVYLRPVEDRLWSVTVSWILITGFLLQFFEESRRSDFKFRLSLIPEFIKSVFLSLQVFCNQGLHGIPQWNSSRIVIILNFALCVALYEAYCAFLISSLTVTTPNIPFTDLDEFLRDGTYKIMTLEKGFHNYYIRTTLHEYGEKGIHLLQDESDLPNTTQRGVRKLCTDEKLTYVEFRENIVSNEIPCKILELPKPIFRQVIGLGLPKHSPYKEILNQQITQLRASGVLHRMKNYLKSYVTLKERDVSDEQFIHVSLWHVVSIFLIIGLGTILSAIIFFLEICYVLSYDRKTPCKKEGKRIPNAKPLKRKNVSFEVSQRSRSLKGRRRSNVAESPPLHFFIP